MNPSAVDEASRPSAIPFLITHWLSQYRHEVRVEDDESTEAHAIARIQSATFELAQAFADLGAFGTTLLGRSRLVPEESEKPNTLPMTNASYHDIINRFTHQLNGRKDLLESIVASSESISQSINPDSTSDHDTTGSRHRWWPLLQAPTLLTSSSVSWPIASLQPSTSVPAAIRDNTLEIFIAAAQASRRYLDVRFKMQHELCPQQSMMLRSRKFHQRLLQQQEDPSPLSIHRDVSHRVLLQLQKALEEIETQRRQLDRDSQMALSILLTLWKQAIFNSTHFASSYHLNLHGMPIMPMNNDNLVSTATASSSHSTTLTTKEKVSNGILRTLVARQYAVGRSNIATSQRTNRIYPPIGKYQSFPLSVSSTWSTSIGSIPPTSRRLPKMISSQPTSSKSVIKTILSSRLSHCATINAHLTFPVYCFCFDKTGKYFFTGADDHLVKAFCLIPSSNIDLEDASHSSRLAHDQEESMISDLSLNHPTLLYDKNQDWSGEDNVLLAPSPTKKTYSTSNPTTAQPVYSQKSYPNIRGGAILVATLRGHAGVINDMDVAVDNSMLATASEDGDVRVWTLHGSKRTAMGIPVAILRGHAGGANMVAWSHRVPYQLVTTAQDGWARVWDVRMAAVKRSVNVLGPRLDYSWISLDHETSSLSSLSKRKKDNSMMNGNHNTDASNGKGNKEYVASGKTNGLTDADMAKNSTTSSGNAGADTLDKSQNDFRLDDIVTAENSSSVNLPNIPAQEQPSLGAFVASSTIDHGVSLISKMFHGSSAAATVSTHTRSRLKAVSVICLSRCPLGGHFATGSDDGVGRIWAEDEEMRIEDMDSHLLAHQRPPRRFHSRASISSTHSGTLIATLTGHLNAITDIQYSYAGDRLLTASQKDGVIRVWSWGSESASVGDSLTNSHGQKKIDNFRHVIIRLTKGSNMDVNVSLPFTTSGHGRRRGGLGSNAAGSDVYCDVAIWSSDDSRIITSQYSPLRSTGTEAITGSHVIFIWDSNLGACLMGINSAHSSGCPVLISHPLDPTILASAGSDGHVKLWDLEDGHELFSYFNSLEHGPIEPPLTKGQSCGYLDGDFSDDGLTLILTDDIGRVCIIDAFQDAEAIKETKLNGLLNAPHPSVGGSLNALHNYRQTTKEPTWMKEQYFANDYYEIFYDTSGYSVEQGSGQPTHLAPRAARCNHNGVPDSERIQDSFRHLTGPMPIKELEVRIARETLRCRALLVRKPGGMLEQNVHGKRLMAMSHSLESTLYVGPKILPMQGMRTQSTSDPINNAQRAQRANPSTGRTLSTNYRWHDYDDVQDDIEIDEMDEDDEDYHDNALNPANASREDDDDDERMSFEEESDESLKVSTRNQRRHAESRRNSQRVRRASRRIIIDDDEEESEEQGDDDSPIRVSRRNLRANVNQRFRYDDPDSSDEEIEELLSRTKIPSGEFAEDYNTLGHYFKMPSKCKVHRNWVTRIESATGFTGQKPYCPQVGDSVVYIPRAHYDTLRTFPNASNISAPWKSFPTNSAWPIVRCFVKDLRYRFPYEMYYRSNGSTKVVSVVVILTLEVTGVPYTSHKRKYPWPKPKFIAGPSSPDPFTFDVSLFLNGEVDFLLPEALYIWRIASLEQMISQERRIGGLLIHTQFYEGDDKEDDDNALVPYPGEIVCATPSCDDELHFKNSGYNVINLRFPHNDLDDSMCVWEISPATGRYNGPRPRTLDRDQKAAVHKIIDELEEDTDIQTYFSLSVDLSRYVDYLSIIEVPMDFSFIRKRLKNDYYSNLLGVRADVRLIRDNCFKYNENDSAISIAARDMFDRFVQRFDEVVNSDIGQREPTVDRHLPLIPDDDDDIDILFHPAIERIEPSSIETIAEPHSPLRRSSRFGTAQSSVIPSRMETATDSNQPVRRNTRTTLVNRVSERPSRAENRTENLRPSTRSNLSLQGNMNEEDHNMLSNTRSSHSHLPSRNGLQNTRLTRSSNSDNIRETRSNRVAQRNPLDEDQSSRMDRSPSSDHVTSQNSRAIRSSNSDNIRETRSNRVVQRNLGTGSHSSRIIHSSISDNGPSSRRLRSLNSGPTNNLRSSVWDNDRDPSNNSTVIRIRMSTNSGGSPQLSTSHNVSLTPNTLRANRGRSRSSGDHPPSVLTDHLPRHHVTFEDARTARRQTRTSAASLLSSGLPDNLRSSSNVLNKRASRRPLDEHENADNKRKRTSEPKSPPKKTSVSKKKVAETKTRSKTVRDDSILYQDPSSDEDSIESLKKVKKNSDNSDASYDSPEEEDDSHTARRVTRKTARKVSSYKEDSDETDNSDSDDGAKRKSSTRNRARKRGRH